MRQTLRLLAVFAVASMAAIAFAGTASADGGAFVGQGCLLGPPDDPAIGHGGVVIAPNGVAVTHCVVPGESSATGLEPQQCFLYTAGPGEIIAFHSAPNGTVVLICSNARSA